MANILSYKQVLDVLQSIAERHFQINSFYVGENHDMNTEDIVYPVLQVYPVVARFPQTGGEYKTIEIRLKVKVVDKDLQDNSTQNDVHSDTLRICQDVLNEINQHPFYIHSNATLIGDIEMTQMNEVFDDFLVGWEFDLTLRLKNMNNFCGIPIAEMPGYSAAGPVDSDFSISWGYLTCETITGCTNLTNFITNYINDNPGILNTTVLNGTNTFTGGTALHPTINVTGGTFSSINVTGGTLSSGGTNLYSIFVTAAGASATTVTAGSNISVSNAGLSYTVSTVASPSFNSVTASGSSSFTTLTGSSFISGSTNIATVINNAATKVQPGLNIYTGGTAQFPTINMSAATLTSLSATTISGGTYYSGATPLSTIITNIVTGSSTNTSIGNGLNTYTGGTATVPKINVSAATLDNLIVTGNTVLSSTTATTLSVLNSGITLTILNDYSGNRINTGVSFSTIIGGSGNTINRDLKDVNIIGGWNISGTTSATTYTSNMVVTGTSMGNLYATNLFSGSTNLYNIFAAASTSTSVLNVNAGSNITTGGTITSPTISLAASPSINTLTLSGTIQGAAGTFTSLSAGTISGGTFEIYNIPTSGSSSNDLLGRNTTTGNIERYSFSAVALTTIAIACSDETTQIVSSATQAISFNMPHGMVLTDARASLSNSGSTTTTVNIKEAGTTIFSTKITIDANKFSSKSSTTQPVLSDNMIADDARITVFIDGAGTGAAGLKIYLIGYKL